MGEPKIPDGDFDIQFSDRPESESLTDTKLRREMEIEHDIATPIDFIMEDYEIDEVEAKKMYEMNKQINSENKQVVDATKDNTNVG